MSDLSTKALITRYQVQAKKRLGQNFIRDEGIIKKLVRLSGIDQTVEVLEIGAGLGILTNELLNQAKRVVSVEIDQSLIAILQETFDQNPKLELISGDFMEVDLKKYFPGNKTEKVVCANLPYYLSTPILFKLFSSEVIFSRIAVMLQQEVAQRFSGLPGTRQYGALSVIAAFKYDIKLLMKVPKEVFIPRPKVDSAVVLFTRKKDLPTINENAFFALVKSCFKYRRKTIYNNYREYAGEEALKQLQKADILPDERAENLSLTQYLRLFEVASEEKSLR